MSAEPSQDRFFGLRLASAEANGFRFAHWIARSHGDHVEPHGHDDAHFMFIVAGAFQTAAGGEQTGPLLVFNPASTFHQDHFLSPGGFFSITVPASASEAMRASRTPTAPSRVENGAAFATTWRLMRECHRGDSEFDAEGLCFELLGAVAADGGAERRRPAWLSEACDLLRNECPLSIADAATRVAVHPIHLTRTFRRFLNCTPGEYQRWHRAQRAAAALSARPKQSAAEIADACGYADQAHLNRSFRRVYGVTPAAYRRSVG